MEGREDSPFLRHLKIVNLHGLKLHLPFFAPNHKKKKENILLLHTKSAPESSDFHRQTWYFGQTHLGYVLDIKMEHKAELLKFVVLPIDVLAG